MKTVASSASSFFVAENKQNALVVRLVEYTLLYMPSRGECCCTLVCEAAIGRSHANRSREVPGHLDTVPDNQRPRPGYDAMSGAGGLIVVIPSAARVRPLLMIVHRCAAAHTRRKEIP